MPTLTKQRQVDLYEFPVNLSPQSRASQGNKVRPCLRKRGKEGGSISYNAWYPMFSHTAFQKVAG